MIEEIQQLVLSGFSEWESLGHVTVRSFGDFLQFNYNAMAQYEGRWNDFEIISRGLIIHAKTGEIVARPFDKFFNWGERGLFSNAPIVSITEKLDGSLGILYRDNNTYKIATRGSLESDQAQWATEYLNKHHNLINLPNEATLLFEIIYPGNRVVVDYGKREDLVLLAGRNRFTGEYWQFYQVKAVANMYGFSTPYQYRFEGIETLYSNLEELSANEEGYVAEFADGQRFKFKSAAYLRLHKLLSSLSFKNILKAMENSELDKFIADIPDEFLGQAKQWIAEIRETVERETIRLNAIFHSAPTVSRKDFALWVMENHKADSRYLFALLDNREIMSLLYRHCDWDLLQDKDFSM